MKYIFLLLAILACSTSGFSAAPSNLGEGPKAEADYTLLEARMARIEQLVENIEGEVEILRAQSRLMIQRTTVGYLNQGYLRGGFALLLPRSRSFDQKVDTGLGGFAGAGRYLGRHQVIEGNLIWDAYPAVELKYRYEFHWDSPLFSAGPVVGYRLKLIDLRPFDNFLEDPSQVKSSFFELGFLVGFPMTRSLAVLEALYLFNQQSILVANIGVHFFL